MPGLLGEPYSMNRASYDLTRLRRTSAPGSTTHDYPRRPPDTLPNCQSSSDQGSPSSRLTSVATQPSTALAAWSRKICVVPAPPTGDQRPSPPPTRGATTHSDHDGWLPGRPTAGCSVRFVLADLLVGGTPMSRPTRALGTAVRLARSTPPAPRARLACSRCVPGSPARSACRCSAASLLVTS